MRDLKVLFLSFFCLFLVSDVFAQDYKVILNRANNLSAINREKGTLDCTEFKKGWWSAQWRFVPVKGAPNFYHIESRQKAGQFIHVEKGTPVCSKLGAPGWWSAQWKLVPVTGTKYHKIVNRARGGKNHLQFKNGKLICGPLSNATSLSAQWDLKLPKDLANNHDAKVRAIQEVVDENGTVIMRYQFRDAGFKYTTECSIPDWLSDPISLSFADIFAPACHTHDYNYRAPWRMAGFSGYVGKDIADDKFYEDMVQICDTRFSGAKELTCRSAALTWSTTMRNHSQSKTSFNNGQKEAAQNCDKSSIRSGGVITVYSDAGYVTEVSISYKKNAGGKSVKIGGIEVGDIGAHSEKITALTSCEMGIPAGATNITLEVNGIGCGLKFVKKFDQPTNKCYKVWGTIFDTEWKETQCK